MRGGTPDQPREQDNCNTLVWPEGGTFDLAGRDDQLLAEEGVLGEEWNAYGHHQAAVAVLRHEQLDYGTLGICLAEGAACRVSTWLLTRGHAHAPPRR